MCQSLLVKDSYFNDMTVGRSIYVEDYYPVSDVDYVDETPQTITKILSPEIDIFSVLPESAYQNERVSAFLNEMKKSLSKRELHELNGVVLPKLRLIEHTENTSVIEWIFNYFRLFFSFDEKEGDYYGEVVNDPEGGDYRNVLRKMEVGSFQEIAEAEIDYAITLAGGGRQ